MARASSPCAHPGFWPPHNRCPQAETHMAAAKQAKDPKLEMWVTKIRIRAERRLGELIQKQKETVGLATGTRGQLAGRDASGGPKTEPPENAPPTLAEAGIDKKLSAWQINSVMEGRIVNQAPSNASSSHIRDRPCRLHRAESSVPY